MNWFDNFVDGIARMIDPFSHNPDVQAILNRSDANAIKSDWLEVIGDWRKLDPPALPHYIDTEQLATWRKENNKPT